MTKVAMTCHECGKAQEKEGRDILSIMAWFVAQGWVVVRGVATAICQECVKGDKSRINASTQHPRNSQRKA